MKRTALFFLSLLILCLALSGQAAVLPEEKYTTCYPIIKGNAFDEHAPVPFSEAFKDDQPQGELEIWFGRISVCDGFIVRCNGESMLIDGGTFSHGAATKALLEKLSITGVDYIFNTHHHDDHLEMQVYLMSHGFKAKEFLTPYPRGYNVAAQRKAEQAADAAGIAYHVIKDGDEMRLGGENGALVQFFRWTGVSEPNYNSVMCKITLGQRSVFLMADVISFAQQSLVSERPDIPWKSDILKAGHHGYTTQDPTLMQWIDPEICIVTNSLLGGKATLDQMKRLSIPAFSTNQGAIYCHTDGGENWYYLQDKTHLNKK